MNDAGLWKRPHSYPRPGESEFDAANREAKNARENCGVVDVSTLGKIELQGKDADGRVVYWSGQVEDDGKGPVETGAHFYRSYQLDADGKATVRVPLQEDEHSHDYSARIEAKVTDASNREVSGRTVVHATWGSFLLSAETTDSIHRAGSAVQVLVRAVDYVGTAQPNVPPKLALERLETYRDRYRPVAERAGMTSDFDAAGRLEVVEDRVGTSSTDFWGISFSPSSLEHDPMDDADLDRALDAAIFMIYSLNGQRCTSSSRLLVQRGVHDGFVERLAERVANIRVGDPLDPATEVGPLIHPRQFEKVCSYFDAARADGATIRVGGERLGDTGNYVRPTLFTNARNDMRIAQEEIFGPVLTVIPFDTDEDALRLANDVPYGLAAYLWTNDLTRAHTFAHGLDSGMIWVNSENVRHLPTPFGGMKASGIGRDGGDYSFDFYMETKNVAINLSGHRAQQLGMPDKGKS